MSPKSTTLWFLSIAALAAAARTQTTSRVSISSAGVQGNQHSFESSISADGNRIAFESESSNLVSGDTNGVSDVFVRDRQTGQTIRASVSSAGVQGNGSSDTPLISADARVVVFSSRATNLVPGAQTTTYDAFARDLVTGQIELVSVTLGGTDSNDASFATGRFVAFASRASNLGGVDANDLLDVFVHDRRADTTVCASVDPTGATGNGFSHVPGLSADGRHVVFQSLASNLVSSDTNAEFDVFVRDLVSSQTSRWSIDSSGAQSNGSTSGVPALSADGRVVTFCSDATNLIAADTNMRFDAFVRALPPADSGFAICAGDGSGTACPCANPGAAGHGCGSVQVAAGGLLEASGTPSASADSYWLTASDLPLNAAVTFVQGSSTLNGTQGAIFGNGLRCVGGTVVRLGTETHAGGTSDFGAPVGNVRISVRGGIPAAGGTRHYQAIYRDGNQSACAPATYNGTNAWSTVWLP